jgi:hypothetical protein
MGRGSCSTQDFQEADLKQAIEQEIIKESFYDLHATLVSTDLR